MNLVLGSGSSYRKKALTDMGYNFIVVTADIDEKAIRFDDPKQLTLALAKAKAEAIIPKLSEPAILITSDQVVVCNGQILEKPTDPAEVRSFYGMYSKYPAETVTAVMVTNTETGQQGHAVVDVAKVYFREIPAESVDKLIEQENVYRWAGGFAIEDPLIAPYVDHIEGTKSSIGGLPKEVTRQLIDEVTDTIPTVAVVIIKDDKVLLVKHGEKASHITGSYGFPAGRIDPGEKPKEAAVRELIEEAGLYAKTPDLVQLPTIRYATLARKSGSQKFSLTTFVCDTYSGKLQATEETSPEWVEIADLGQYETLPDIPAIIAEAQQLQTSLEED